MFKESGNISENEHRLGKLFTRGLHSSETLSSLVTDILIQPVRPIFKGQGLIDILFRNVGN
jgi:hypothetical protein